MTAATRRWLWWALQVVIAAVVARMVWAAIVRNWSEFRSLHVSLDIRPGWIALSVLAVLVFLGSWNDYLWPLIVLRSPEKFTYPLGLATLYGLYKIEYGMILAGAFIATVPIILIFIAGRKQLLNNLTVGAIKG